MALRLREFRETAGLTLEQVAERLGMSHSQISRIERGASDFTGKTLRALAELYGVEMSTLIASQAPSDAEPIDLPDALRRQRTVPIVGYVGGGAEVYYPEGDAWPVDEVEVPGAGSDTEAVILRGDSMAPAYRDRDLIIYRRATTSPRDLLGEECVVRVADGRTFIKTLMPGSEPSLFTLVSHNPSMPPIVDVAIEWAVPVVMRISGRHRLG